jgi:AraC-like DNA-binding protein
MRINSADIKIEFVSPGEMRLPREQDGYLHRKVVPELIVVQVLEGHYDVIAGARKVKVTPGACLVTLPGEPLSFTHRVDPASGFFRSRWVHLRCTFHGGIDLFSLIEAPLCVSRERSAPIDGLLGELVSRRTESDLDAALATGAAVYALLRWIWSVSKPSPQALWMDANASRMAPLLTFIREHLAENPSGAVLAEQAGLSRSALYMLFEKCTGLPPRKYVESLRLRRAADLLRQGPSLSIGEISDQLGYQNPFHFSRAFKRRLGMSPKRFRETSAGTMGPLGTWPSRS